ncbi:hypothetical protein [Sulfurimonas sp. C5]|nr:hypothetical protein [Sulfurimonas sp. C5]MDH4943666.1 hypothetical protein [Sulfurimonas sp. C5]
MPDMTQPVEMSFILSTIGVVFAIVAVGIVLVKLGKKSRNS